MTTKKALRRPLPGRSRPPAGVGAFPGAATGYGVRASRLSPDLSHRTGSRA